MRQVCLVLVLLSCLWEQRSVEAITLDAHMDEYLKGLIKEFQVDASSSRYDHAIIPPRIGETIQDFLLPRVFIWCPMQHYNLKILCPVHKSPLTAGYFTDELIKKGPRNPRLVYDVGGNILLVQRFYICQNGGIKHRYLSASQPILSLIPKLHGIGCFPIVMFYKSACTKQLINFVETQTLQGVNFLSICGGLAALNFKEFNERVACFSLSQTSPNETQTLTERFYSDSLYAFPGNKKLMEIFLANFVDKQAFYDDEMEKIARTSSCITCDHTFKVSKYICASRGSDKKCIKQFENLYVVLNENHQVVAWRLTKSTKFEEIRDLLNDLKHCLENELEYIIVDDCCRVRSLYQSIFPSAKIKLDLFHAVQRVIRTFPKGSQWSKQVSTEFGLIFRVDGDCGESRNFPTPEPDILERNLDNFIKRWKCTLNDGNGNKTFSELENLRNHIRKGCLSGIKPGQGTECNERLHQTLNKSLLCGSTTIGPEIAIAVLSLIFYGLNCRKQGKKHNNNSRVIPFVPLPSTATVGSKEKNRKAAHFNSRGLSENINLDNVWSGDDFDKSSITSLTSDTVLVLEDVEDMCNDTLSALLLKNTNMLKETLTDISKQCKDRSFNAYDLPVLQSVSGQSVLSSADNDTSQREHNDLLKRNLASFNLLVDPVDGDGDCVFRSIIQQLRTTSEWAEGKPQLMEHLKSLGLTNESIDEDVFCLRQLFVDSVQSNDYYQMLLGISQEDINAETERFRDQGTFSGEVGDLVLKVCSDILQIPILVVTSLSQCTCVPFIPDQQVIRSTLYVAYNAFGPGHYDGTVAMTVTKNTPSDVKGCRENNGCSCGKNSSVDGNSSCMPGSRCPCIKQERCCLRNCRCKGCQNRQKSGIGGDSQHQSQIQPTGNHKSCRCGESTAGNSPTLPACADGKRKSRCPCLNANQQCGITCSCRNCANPYGAQKHEESVYKVGKKRQRINPSPYKRARSADYLASLNVPLDPKVWTVYEQCLLMTIASFLASTLASPSIENVTHLYNHVANSNACEEAKFPIRTKSCGQIAGKLKQLEEKRGLLNARTETDV